LQLCNDERKFRLRRKQLLYHYLCHFTTDPQQMTDLPHDDAVKDNVVALASTFTHPLDAITVQTGDGGQTIKTLYQLQDGNRIESVLMYYNGSGAKSGHATLCISCQVGCAMGCEFCATGKLGLKRNLTVPEMVEQVRLAMEQVHLEVETRGGDQPRNSGVAQDSNSNIKLTNVVFMGMGEPTQNLANIFQTLDYLCHDATQSKNQLNFGLSARNITISTVGDVKGIDQLTADPRPFRLAVSLHTPLDSLRRELIPTSLRWSVDDILDAALNYYQTKNRRVSIEYALIRDVNDSVEQAKLLAKLLNRRGTGWAHVNLIPLNVVDGSKWTASTPEATEAFTNQLSNKGVPVTLRHSRGQDIDGACGQLANQLL
jgi:23S rRNA (adenine2503-C2)-methyltransferase